MPNDLMLRCEQRKEYKVKDGYEWRWKEVAVSEAVGAQPTDIRCKYCYGAMQIHRQQVEHGPRDHVEHRLRQDSESCCAGFHFKGGPEDHKMSTQPVL